ncbi:DNA-binding transcriptional regulator, MarR family [Micromonospora rhizosphaerae]|uniref:DNA-binding transcriptional regulator, MarR family n=1 Tax=Micromonospora rhizosphaerae TaxID=568872 RepID=A0A1C6RGR4_9ACTN|nr:MarR family transcriptional regulator [Micromonospora rhizosphaerae]SCL16323.1 DNA-binding transcriptional regulator, MarR family [Micromonospora rhizosphaerae]
MDSVASEDARRHRRTATRVKDAMRELSNQLGLLNHHVGVRLSLRDVDLDCLDLIARHGPISPGALARRAGLHPATVTGILDRLQRGGWIVRERDPAAADRRSVTVRALRERNAEVYRLYAGMNASMDEICAGYDASQLELIADFLHRAGEAGRRAADELADG